MKFQHGGMLEKIKLLNPDQVNPWIDLSTGVSPFSYPVNKNEDFNFQSLPQYHQALKSAASKYYGVDNLLNIPGSMWAIQNLPLLRMLQTSRNSHVKDERMVLLPKEGFNEHIKAWRLFGFEIETYNRKPTVQQLSRAQACIVINPNNPNGDFLTTDQLRDMLLPLAENNAWLIVDEAFIDPIQNQSICTLNNQDGLIVLRSFGKFFGLPGLRLGALIANESLLNEAYNLLNEWSISNAAQLIAEKAFKDVNWQYEAVNKLQLATDRLKQLLKSCIGLSVGTYLFQTVYKENSKFLYEYLLQNGIYARLLDSENGIRFGLPKEEWQWLRLEQVLSAYKINHKIKTEALI